MDSGASRGRLAALQTEIVACRRCARLAEHCQTVARVKRRAYLDWEYWGQPVPSFGDPDARLLLVGLAPGAHGANRTGRVFTGDSSGDFLYEALFQTGFASQPEATSRDDGLVLRDCYIASAVRCAPPQNRPLPHEFAACRPFLEREVSMLPQLRAVVTLGRLAHDSWLAVLRARDASVRARDYPFAHGRHFFCPGNEPDLLCSYHPSRQNTQTGRLTKPMLVNVLQTAKEIFSDV
ncbi:MAG: uracil-DNA glycosylase [Acidobacteriia bacterium]|nr:uracil-DNA glycosylase [Terriglobia bacterium]MYC66114.1 uracil-DNA glycosylase [Terriglobia bacterium]